MENFKVVRFVDNDFILDVRADEKNDTVWLTAEEMGELFGVNRPNIVKHANNIINSNELNRSTCSILEQVQIEGQRKITRKIKIYNLDMIISVGYRVNSKRGITFRRWANSVLRQYLIQGYALNDRRLENLGKVVDIQNRMLSYSLNIDRDELSKVIDEYSRALDLLDEYDHQVLPKVQGAQSEYVMSYEEAREIINSMKFKEMSNVFGVEKEKGKLKGIIDQVYQNVFGKELYPSVQDKAAHLLYFLVKDHPFADGCKRIAATLFINFLYKTGHLYKDNKQIISNEGLVAITILTAESNPDEMEIIIKLITNLL